MPKKFSDYVHLYLKSNISVFVFPDESITDGFLDKYLTMVPNGVYNPVLNEENYKRLLEGGFKPILKRIKDAPAQDRADFKSLFEKNECNSYVYSAKFL